MSLDGRLPIIVVACKVFEDQLNRYLPTELVFNVNYLDYGLHKVPRDLKRAMQAKIDSIEEPSLILLGFGLCGNGLHGIKAGRHTLLIPRTDDCIAILLGSYRAYQEEFEVSPGTYYLSIGWLEAGSNPLQEYRDYVTRYGEEQAQWLMDQQYAHYRRLAFVSHQEADLAKYRTRAQEVAQFCSQWGMKYEELVGSDDYIARLVEVALDLSKADREFLVIPPGAVLEQSQFFRLP